MAAQQKRVLVDTEGGNQRMLGRAGEVLSQCEICQASEEAPYLPAAGASSGGRDFRWVLRVRSTPLPFARWICTPRFPSRRDYARRTPRSAGCFFWLANRGFWPPRVRTYVCAERYIRLQFLRKGAHPWAPGRRIGLELGIYNRLAADDRVSSRSILHAVQFRMK